MKNPMLLFNFISFLTMDMVEWDNMDDFDNNILLGNFALEIPSMDKLMDIPTQQLIKPEQELSNYRTPLSDKEID